MRVLGVFEDPEDALEAWRKYVSETGYYAAIRSRPAPKGGKRTYEVWAYDERCLLRRYIDASHHELRELAKHYLRTTKIAQSMRLALRSLPHGLIYDVLESSLSEKQALIKRIEPLIEPHPIYRWCKVVRAGRGSLGASTALIFLGFIDPHEATTAGKVWAFWGLSPAGKRRRGERAKGRFDLKGVAVFAATRVVMGRDPYYRPYWEAKRSYYLDVKGFGRKKAADKATFWLAKLLASHAWEIYRKSENLPVNPHRLYIAPKEHEDQEAEPEIVKKLARGEV